MLLSQSALQHICGQLFITEFSYTKFILMRFKSEVHDLGVSKEIYTDEAKELTMGTWRQMCHDSGIKMSHKEKDSP
jgi:hypothetical protein